MLTATVYKCNCVIAGGGTPSIYRLKGIFCDSQSQAKGQLRPGSPLKIVLTTISVITGQCGAGAFGAAAGGRLGMWELATAGY